MKDKIFQSTPSARRATFAENGGTTAKAIPIHARRAEGDAPGADEPADSRNFNPRPPRGGRLEIDKVLIVAPKFQSTPSVGRATRCAHAEAVPRKEFQSTPSARRATSSGSRSMLPDSHFNPRPPRGERQQKQRKNPMLLFHYTRLCTI